jgi:hypothetical protein
LADLSQFFFILSDFKMLCERLLKLYKSSLQCKAKGPAKKSSKENKYAFSIAKHDSRHFSSL